MTKFFYILRQMRQLIAEHKLYFFAPLFFLLALLAFLFFKLGPALVISFIYAGV